jgi:tetratricopeptide (TPR) repeat protein
MTQNQLKNLAIKYCVEDLKDSSLPGTSLSIVISRLELAPDYIPEATKDYLRKSKLKSLLKYACNQISFNEFSLVAKSEQKERKLEADKLREKQAKQAVVNAEKNRKLELFRKLLSKYDLSPSFVNTGDGPRLKDILEKAEHGTRLSQDEVAWLMVSPRGMYSGYYTQRLREKYHRIEAEYYLIKFQQSKNSWDVINASSHFRKCNQSSKADSILVNINTSEFKSQKTESAFNTTYGGVKRDLKEMNEALSFGNKAHLLTPNDFRPCTLLGAINIEIGNYEEGQSWYRKAIERGATEKSVDDDLRSIFKRSDTKKCKELALFLLKNDPDIYSWVTKYIKQ